MLKSSLSLEDSDRRMSRSRFNHPFNKPFRSRCFAALIILLGVAIYVAQIGQTSKVLSLLSEINQQTMRPQPPKSVVFEYRPSVIRNFSSAEDRKQFAEVLDDYLLTLTGNVTVDDPVNHEADALAKEVMESIPPRAYPRRLPSQGLPCVQPVSSWFRRSTAKRGLLFVKPGKVGGSTAAGINNRMARNYADRIGATFPICQSKFHHGDARTLYGQRDKSQSLMWTILRNPQDRWISTFFFNAVARMRRAATYEQFLRHLEERLESKIFGREFYLKEESVSVELDIKHLCASILYDYDFVAVTERMDESIVAMALLWNVPLSDVLYLSAKTGGGFDDGRSGKCKTIPSARKDYPDFFADPRVKKLLASEYFHSIIRFDTVVYQLANQSLDYTIDTIIGRAKFQQTLQKYKHAQEVARETCADEVIFPCSNGGKIGTEREPYSYRETDCLYNDQGCGYMCLDQVATDLGLWPTGTGMNYRFPREFGLGPSTQKRLKEIAQ